MDDLISKNRALTLIRERRETIGDPKLSMGMYHADLLIRNLPSAERHGRWEKFNNEVSLCSECGMLRDIRTQFAWDYCPNCGAKMDEKEEDHESKI